MSNRIGLLLLLGLLWGWSNSLYAQNQTVSGTVRDAETGERLPYASVLVIGTQIGTASNVDGYFVLLGVPADSLTLQLTYLGYRTTLVQIDARTLDEPLTVEMTPIATELDEVLDRVMTDPALAVEWELARELAALVMLGRDRGDLLPRETPCGRLKCQLLVRETEFHTRATPPRC